jgi:hypothetical protein
MLIVLSANCNAQIKKSRQALNQNSVVKKESLKNDSSEQGCENIIAETFTNKKTRKTYSISVTFNDKDESNFNYKIDPQFYKDFKTNFQKVDSYLRKSMGDDYNIFARDGGHADCVNNCFDRYTDDKGNKIRGRGACRAGCWVDSAIEILKEVSSFL